MQHPAHAPAKRGIDQLVLGHAADTGELRAGDAGGVVLVIASKIGDRYVCVGQGGADQRFDIGCGAGLLCEPFTRLGAQVIGVDPSATNIAAARLHADKGHLSIDYRCTTVEEVDHRERFDIVLAMEVIEHVTDVGAFLARCAAMVKPGGLMVVSTLNRNWKSFALAIVGAEYVLRWLPRGTHEWNKFVTPDELARHLAASKLAITEETGVVYSPLADKWGLSADMDVNYMVVAEEM